jgi:tetratricopeptide (TPR) repeat protein
MASKRIWTVLSLCLSLCLAVLLASACASGPPPTAVERGEAALADGDWRSAKAHFAEALQAESGSGRAWLGQARAQLAGRDPEGALRSLSSLSRVDRPLFDVDGRAVYLAGLEGATRLRLRRDQSKAALEAARALTRLEPDRPNLDRLLGSALVAEAARRRWLGESRPALSLYREACQVVPATLDAWLGAAEILIELNQGKQAIQLLVIARKTHPTAGQIRTLTIQALALR